MKWNQFVVQEGNSESRNSPVSHLDVSKSNFNLSNQKRFTLKSLEKLALNLSKNQKKQTLLREQENSENPVFKRMMSKTSFMSNNFSRLRDENSLDRKSSRNTDKEGQTYGQVYEAFIKEFQSFTEAFFNRYDQAKLKVLHQQVFQKKMLEKIQQSLNNFFKEKENKSLREDSPSKNIVVIPKICSSNDQSPTLEKKFSRALQFKNEKIIQKDLYNDSQQQKIRLEQLISNIKKGQTDVKRKFTRTGSRSKRDHSQNSSVQEIIEKSFNDSHRSSRGRLQAREAIYKFNQVFNQSNLL